MIDLYLQDEHKEHRKDIEAIATKTRDAAADAQLQAYAREALRLSFLFVCYFHITDCGIGLDPSFRGTYRECMTVTLFRLEGSAIKRQVTPSRMLKL